MQIIKEFQNIFLFSQNRDFGTKPCFYSKTMKFKVSESTTCNLIVLRPE